LGAKGEERGKLDARALMGEQRSFALELLHRTSEGIPGAAEAADRVLYVFDKKKNGPLHPQGIGS
jgi:hypothetical protein